MDGTEIAKEKESSEISSDALIEAGQPGYIDTRASEFGKLPAEIRRSKLT